jgi:hypothetical protein
MSGGHLGARQLGTFKASDKQYFEDNPCLAHFASLPALVYQWGRCFKPSRATYVHGACMKCSYDGREGNDSDLPTLGGQCHLCGQERMWDVNIMTSLDLSALKAVNSQPFSFATMSECAKWMEWLAASKSSSSPTIPQWLMLHPACTGGVFSAPGFEPSESDKPLLASVLENGFKASIMALRVLCVSLGLSVPQDLHGSNVPPESERAAWKELDIRIQQGMTAQFTLRMSRHYVPSHLLGKKDIVVSVAHLAGRVTDSEGSGVAGVLGPPESLFRHKLLKNAWINNLTQGGWISVLTAAKRDGFAGAAYGPTCPPPWVEDDAKKGTFAGQSTNIWDLPDDEYAKLLHEQASVMMQTQDSKDEAAFRRSKLLRWSRGHDIISIYQVIHVRQEHYMNRFQQLADIVQDKQKHMPSVSRRINMALKAGLKPA